MNAPPPAHFVEARLASPARALRAATSFYLLLPIGLFAYGWLRPALALPMLAVILFCLAAMARDLWPALHVGWVTLRASPRAALAALAWTLPALLLLAAWLALSGAGGLGYQNDDYRASNALLKSLILGDWPLVFQLDGQPVRLVYYVAYYLPAAAVGKLAGWRAANAALWLWTALGAGLAFVWFQHLSRVAPRGRAGRLFLLAALFCLAGGLDYFAQTALQGVRPAWSAHTEFWAGYFQYSSNTTLLYWVPQQALAAWLMLSLVVDALYHAHDLRYLGLTLAAGLLWSPLGVVGLLPYLLLLAGVYAAPARRHCLWRPAALCAHAAALGLAVVLGLYLAANRYTFPAGWIWQGVAGTGRLARYFVSFWWVEFGALTMALVVFLALGLRLAPAPGWRVALRQRFDLEARQVGLFALCLASLTLLPLFRLGFNNDLAMRASIPSLLVLWMFAAKVVDAGRGLAARSYPLPLRLAYLLLVVVLVAGFMTGLGEVARSVQFYRLGPPPLESVSAMAEADRRHLVEQRVGDEKSFFFRYLAR
jgi:hypothetical protein